MGRIPGLGGASRPKKPVPETAPSFGRATGRPDVAFRRPVVRPRGSKLLGLGQKRRSTGGPGLPPPGFVTGTTSGLEWYWYWASGTVLGDPPDVRKPPFVGGLFWNYQVPDNPMDVRSLGFAVSDFVYQTGTGELVVRIDSFYYHIATTSDQIARDLYLKLHGGSEDLIIVSAYDDDILGDPTGRAACAAVADALRGREPISPVRSGLAFPVRDAIAENAQ